MDFRLSEEMRVRLDMINEFMTRDVIPLEGELLHGTPLAAAVAGSPGQGEADGL